MWLLGVHQIAKCRHSMVKEKDYTRQRLGVKRKAAARNRKAICSKAHSDRKKEGTIKYVHEKLWLTKWTLKAQYIWEKILQWLDLLQ